MTSTLKTTQIHEITYILPSAKTITGGNSESIAAMEDVIPNGAKFLAAKLGYNTTNNTNLLVFGAFRWYSAESLYAYNTGNYSVTLPQNQAIIVTYYLP